MGMKFSLLLKGACSGELDDLCAGLCGERLWDPLVGGWKTTFLREETFLIGRSGDEEIGLLSIDGIGAWS
jgi:hypothetical protein